MEKATVITRFPPSPTGLFHIGSARTALFNFLFAKQNKGKFFIRIEDTDRERSRVQFEDDIFDNLKWLGLKPDNDEIIHQSGRTDVYKKYLSQLIDTGKAYISKETEGENKEVVRFKNPNIDVVFKDLIRGEITFNTKELGDFIIARNIDDPLYHLAVVVDDLETGVTHVIRGEDGISNTPRQILILEALGGKRPVYAHLPLVLAKDRSKLSKRKHGEIVSLSYYRQKGYLPQAIINYIALLGWNPGNDQEIFSLTGLIEQFQLAKVQKGGAVFDEEKLRWFNKEHLNKLNDNEFRDCVEVYLARTKFGDSVKFRDETFMTKFIKILRERISTCGDIEDLAKQGDFDYYFNQPVYEAPRLVWKADAGKVEEAGRHLMFVKNVIETIDETNFNREIIKEELWGYATEKGRGQVLWPLRFALSGKDHSPDPFELAEILGKTETIDRIDRALSKTEASRE